MVNILIQWLILCSSQPARDWKSWFFLFFHFFHFDHHFFGLKIIIPFLSPLSFFIIFSSCFSSLWHFHFSFLCFENGPWSLGIATRGFFSNPFRLFFRLLLRFSYFFSPMPLKLTVNTKQNQHLRFCGHCLIHNYNLKWNRSFNCPTSVPLTGSKDNSAAPSARSSTRPKQGTCKRETKLSVITWQTELRM